MATHRKRKKKVVRRVAVGRCDRVGAEIKAKGDSTRAKRRRAHGGFCLVKKRVSRPVKAKTRIVLSAAETERRRKRRAKARKAASKKPARKRAKR